MLGLRGCQVSPEHDKTPACPCCSIGRRRSLRQSSESLLPEWPWPKFTFCSRRFVSSVTKSSDGQFATWALRPRTNRGGRRHGSRWRCPPGNSRPRRIAPSWPICSAGPWQATHCGPRRIGSRAPRPPSGRSTYWASPTFCSTSGKAQSGGRFSGFRKRNEVRPMARPNSSPMSRAIFGASCLQTGMADGMPPSAMASRSRPARRLTNSALASSARSRRSVVSAASFDSFAPVASAAEGSCGAVSCNVVSCSAASFCGGSVVPQPIRSNKAEPAKPSRVECRCRFMADTVENACWMDGAFVPAERGFSTYCVDGASVIDAELAEQARRRSAHDAHLPPLRSPGRLQVGPIWEKW